MEVHEKIHRNRKKMLLDNFLGGMAWGIGLWVGTAILVAVAAYFASNVDLVPIVGDFIQDVTQYMVSQTNYQPQ